jgi:hypothetical protein
MLSQATKQVSRSNRRSHLGHTGDHQRVAPSLVPILSARGNKTNHAVGYEAGSGSGFRGTSNYVEPDTSSQICGQGRTCSQSRTARTCSTRVVESRLVRSPRGLKTKNNVVSKKLPSPKFRARGSTLKDLRANTFDIAQTPFGKNGKEVPKGKEGKKGPGPGTPQSLRGTRPSQQATPPRVWRVLLRPAIAFAA